MECRRSIASVAVLTAVSKPNDRWVPLTSLSIVLGTQTTGQPPLPQLVGNLEAALTADRDQGIESAGLKGRDQIVGPIDLLFVSLGVTTDVSEGIPAIGGAQNGATEMGNATYLRWAKGDNTLKADEALESPLNAVAMPSAVVRRQDDGADDRIQAGGVTASGGDGDAHRSLFTSQPLDGLDDFTRCSVAASGLLGENQLSVDCHLEQSTGGLDQADLRVGERLLQLSRQTGSSGLVVSNHAVLNGHIHCSWALA